MAYRLVPVRVAEFPAVSRTRGFRLLRLKVRRWGSMKSFGPASPNLLPPANTCDLYGRGLLPIHSRTIESPRIRRRLYPYRNWVSNSPPPSLRATTYASTLLCRRFFVTLEGARGMPVIAAFWVSIPILVASSFSFSFRFSFVFGYLRILENIIKGGVKIVIPELKLRIHF